MWFLKINKNTQLGKGMNRAPPLQIQLCRQRPQSTAQKNAGAWKGQFWLF